MIAWFNSQWLPLEQVAIPVTDLGFTMGVTIVEQIRTFSGEPKLIHLHLQRFARGLGEAGIEIDADVAALVHEAVDRNRLAPGQSEADFAIGVCATPGTADIFTSLVTQPAASTLLVYAKAVDQRRERKMIDEGVSLQTVPTRELPAECLPKTFKCRSRMHYWLAQRQAASIEAGSLPLLLTTSGDVAESVNGTIVMFAGDRVIAPPADAVLDGVALKFLTSRNMKIDRRRIAPGELANADEIAWLNAVTGPVSVVKLDDGVVGTGQPGPGFKKLRRTWESLLK